MKTILLTNDDGYLSAGIQKLKERLVSISDYEVYTVAPDRERSAISMSLTINHPLRLTALGERDFIVDGTPSDCVAIALQAALPRRPDFVLSGMNFGENLGEDVFYSGTVAAAYAGVAYGIPSLAVSLVGQKNPLLPEHSERAFNIEEGIEITLNVLQKLIPLNNHRVVFNLNIPNPLKGPVRLTTLGKKCYKPSIIEKIDPRGKKYYWIGTGEPIADGTEGTDIQTITEGNSSLSLLKYDLNCPDEFKNLMEIFK